MTLRRLVIVCLSIAWAGIVHAQTPVDNASRLSVSGSGQVKVMPDSMVMLCVVSGEAELASDAVVKFRDAKRRAIESLGGLGIEGLKIEPMGMSVSARFDDQELAMMRGMGGFGSEAPTTAKPQIMASESLRLTIEDIGRMEPEAMADALSGLIESVQDAGLKLGGDDMSEMAYSYGNETLKVAVFQVTDPEPSLAEARRLAVADSRRRAEALAEETGVRLGRVVQVNENDMYAGTYGYGMNPWQAMYAQTLSSRGETGASAPRLTDTFAPVSVGTQVSLSFEVLAGDAP